MRGEPPLAAVDRARRRGSWRARRAAQPGRHRIESRRFTRQQVQDETDELRRRRMAQMAGGSPATVGTRAALASPVGVFGLGGSFR